MGWVPNYYECEWVVFLLPGFFFFFFFGFWGARSNNHATTLVVAQSTFVVACMSLLHTSTNLRLARDEELRCKQKQSLKN